MLIEQCTDVISGLILRVRSGLIIMEFGSRTNLATVVSARNLRQGGPVTDPILRQPRSGKGDRGGQKSASRLSRPTNARQRGDRT